MINWPLQLFKTWHESAYGINALLAGVPRLPGDVATVEAEIYSEIDLDGAGEPTTQSAALAAGRFPTPAQGAGGVGKVLVGITLARPGWGLDPHHFPIVQDDEVALLHLFGRRTDNGPRGTRDLGYVFHAAMRSIRRLSLNQYANYRATSGNYANTPLGLIDQVKTSVVPAYQMTDDVHLLMGLITVWTFRDNLPKGE